MSPLDFDIKSSTVEKLIDVVSSAIGKLSAPYLIRKMAAAKGQEILVIAESVEKAGAATGHELGVEYDGGRIAITSKEAQASDAESMLRRIDDRIRTIEVEHQKNLDRITLFGLREAAQISSSAAEAPIDADWTNRFFGMAQDVSNEQMQELWGKILAGEVNRPGSFSLRSLELLRNLSQREAESFRQMIQYRVEVGDDRFYIFPNKRPERIGARQR